jgi:uncharacterized protein (TIGR02001 family)
LAGLAATGATLGAPALAAAPWGGSLQLTTDYVFRGVSQSGHDAALQADLHWRAPSGWFVGAWASSIAAPQGTFGNYELNVYAGRSWLLSERWGGSLRYVRYAYPNSPLGQRYDSDEVTLAFDLDDRLVLSVAGSPDTSRYASQGWALRRRTLAFEAALRQPLGSSPLALLASAGYYDTRSLLGAAYRAWSAGLVLRIDTGELVLQRYAADDTARRLFADGARKPRWALSANWRF